MLILGMNGIEAMGLPDELGGTLGCSVIHCQLQGVAMIISILREPIDSDATANDARKRLLNECCRCYSANKIGAPLTFNAPNTRDYLISE